MSSREGLTEWTPQFGRKWVVNDRETRIFMVTVARDEPADLCRICGWFVCNGLYVRARPLRRTRFKDFGVLELRIAHSAIDGSVRQWHSLHIDQPNLAPILPHLCILLGETWHGYLKAHGLDPDDESENFGGPEKRIPAGGVEHHPP